jgi:peptide/nickel transport system substrate-binding protein
VRRLATALTLAACLFGCTRLDQSGGAGRHPWTQPNHLRLASTEEPDSLNKLFANSDAADQIASLLFAPVLRYDDRGEFLPELVTTVPSLENGGISRDGKTIVFHFRSGMQWSDGAPLDGRDLRFTWRAVMNDRNNTRLRSGWDDITAIDVPDPLTAIVRLRAPYAAILGIFALGGAGYPPLPEHLLGTLRDLNRAPFNAKPISSGPWLLTAWNHGASLEFAANPRYWRGPPKIARLTYRIIPNADTLLNALRTHEIDVDDAITENQIDALRELQGVTTAKRLVANWRHIAINTRKPALADVRVRRAIALAVDWDRMNRTIYHGYNERAVSDIVPTSWAAPSIPQWSYDPDAAKALLTRAGWTPGPDGIRRRNGARLALDISSTTAKQANVQAEVQMQQQLRAVGIELTIKNYPTSFLFAQNGPLYGGTYDLSLTMDTYAPDPDNEGNWSADFMPPKGANTTFLADPVITATSHEAAHTVDRARRKALYQRQAERIHELVPVIFLYWQVAYAAYNSDLKNYKPAQYISSNWNSWEWEL